jgi:2-methylcitrate dehydratase PrpD
VEGRFSVEYVIAAALVDGELGLSTFDDKPIRQELRALAACVQRRYDATLAPAPNAMPKSRFTVVSVTLANGTTYIERVDCPRGAPGNPLSTEERLAKYHDAIQGLPAAWAELPGLVDRLENLTDLSQFIPNNV